MNTASDLHFEDCGLHDGIWHGHLTGAVAPVRLLLTQAGAVLAEAAPVPDAEGGWRMALPLPAQVQAGAPVPGDLMAEVALLRGEVDLLKRALRQLAGR